ncbi:hypothetical protein NQ317_008603 [Molorchus minor]|uniref:Uncharacterized protein n=1 Tax=Molorchus minor TaxID=1323400 RepID=A0ABQ9JBN7_9CUCU|nr:hypothetical protein NQ317_008603 [Molorchus minor]
MEGSGKFYAISVLCLFGFIKYDSSRAVFSKPYAFIMIKEEMQNKTCVGSLLLSSYLWHDW